ncbi:MAG: glycosyltransferase family 4 protein [Chitinophagaceae bacterium]|nr:glycosyltransferase family 4 protein [Chitinophagaceae bacterium]
MRYMKDQGFEVIMVSSEGEFWPDIIQNEQCDYRIVPMKRDINPIADFISLMKLYFLFRKEKPDIVHSHTPKAGLLSMLAARLAGVPVKIHTVAGLRLLTLKGIKRKILFFTEKITAWAANQIWPNSFSLKEYLIKNKIADAKKVNVIAYGSSNGVDLKKFSPEHLDTEVLTEIKKKLAFSENLFYFLNIGRIVRDKGIDEIVSAFVELNKDYPDLRLVIIGKYEDELDPVSRITREYIEKHPGIIRIEWTKEIACYLHLCHVFIHASYREGFPSILLQAGAMECPIVCSRIDGNTDVVTEETGYLFTPGNKEDLKTKMLESFHHYKLLKQKAQKLKSQIREKYNQEFVHKCIKDKYLELLKKCNSKKP